MNANALADQQRAKPIIQKAFRLLREKLPRTLYYHTAEHSDDVLLEAMHFAVEDKLDQRSCELLAIAAAYHDTGFIEAAQENEALGAQMAAAAMHEQGGYSTEEIELVKTMILDTSLRSTPEGMRQVPTTLLSRYLCDADVSNLGREDFFEKAELIRKEIGSPPIPVFLAGVLKFLACHQWHTEAARRLRSTQRANNLSELEKKLKS